MYQKARFSCHYQGLRPWERRRCLLRAARPVCPAERDGLSRPQLVDTAHLDGANPQIRTHPRENEIRNRPRYHAHDPSINVYHCHTHIDHRTLASCIPRQLVNPHRDLRNSPHLHSHLAMRQHLSPARDPILPARAEEHKHIHPRTMQLTSCCSSHGSFPSRCPYRQYGRVCSLRPV